MDQSEVLKFEQQTTLTLSQAIRIGARLRPQARSCFFYEGKSCALGAAFEAVYGYPNLGCVGFSTRVPCKDIPFSEALSKAFPELSGNLKREIWQRNDIQRQSREQIADWLEKEGY